jgi:membrane protein implicated in regulation of membrane protease activity
MNSTLIFVLLLITIVMSTRLLDTWMKQRKQPASAADEELEEALGKIDELEERVRVLERIITENRFDLKQEIDSL